jgi:2'-5' RNA ligase
MLQTTEYIQLKRVIMIRAFIGVELENDIKEHIYELQQGLRRYAAKGRWERIGNYHLTLKFLDEINVSQQKQIDEVLRRICAEQSSFRLEAAEPGIFNGRDSIRVLWLGLGGDLRPLRSFAGEIDSCLSQIGFTPENRRFAPHITIGRDIVFECPFEQIRESIGPVKYGPIDVARATLFKSEQIQGKRVYSKVSEYAFRQ